MSRVRLPVTEAHPFWPSTYVHAMVAAGGSAAVQLAYFIDPAVVERPEEYLRARGYSIYHQLDPVADSLTLEGARASLASMEWDVATQYWRLVYEHTWWPWLEERGWEPMTGAASCRHRPPWRGPSGRVYDLWSFNVSRPLWAGAGVAFAREGVDPAAVMKEAQASAVRGMRARIKRWGRNPLSHDTDERVVRALEVTWPYGSPIPHRERAPVEPAPSWALP